MTSPLHHGEVDRAELVDTNKKVLTNNSEYDIIYIEMRRTE
jgi:hypothetical protein